MRIHMVKDSFFFFAGAFLKASPLFMRCVCVCMRMRVRPICRSHSTAGADQGTIAVQHSFEDPSIASRD